MIKPIVELITSSHVSSRLLSPFKVSSHSPRARFLNKFFPLMSPRLMNVFACDKLQLWDVFLWNATKNFPRSRLFQCQQKFCVFLIEHFLIFSLFCVRDLSQLDNRLIYDDLMSCSCATGANDYREIGQINGNCWQGWKVWWNLALIEHNLIWHFKREFFKDEDQNQPRNFLLFAQKPFKTSTKPSNTFFCAWNRCMIQIYNHSASACLTNGLERDDAPDERGKR